MSARHQHKASDGEAGGERLDLSHDARLLEVKIALEAEIRPALLALLMSHAEARLNGQRPITLPALEKLLLRHYARTVMIVTGRRPPLHPTLNEAAISFTHGERLRLRARAHAQIILAGLERDIARANVWHADPDAGAAKSAETKDVADRVRRGYVGLVALLGRVYDRISGRIGGIANAETNGVAEEARFEVAAGETAANATLYKVWSTMLDSKVRPAHAAAEGQGSNGSVRAESPFVVGGERLMFPGDTSLGASLGNVINCFPAGTQVSGAVTAATRSWYDGDIVEITTRSGKKIAGTPHHPVLTQRGWVALRDLDERRDRICCTRIDADGARVLHGGHDIDDVQTGIEQVFDALAVRFGLVREPSLAVDFHGDRPAHEVDVVRADRVLRVGEHTAVLQQLSELGLSGSLLAARGCLPECFARFFDVAGRRSPPSGVGSRGDGLPLFGGRAVEPEPVGVAAVAGRHASIGETCHNDTSANADVPRDGQHRVASVEPLEHVGAIGLSRLPCGFGLVNPAGPGESSLLHGLGDEREAATALGSHLSVGEAAPVEFDDVAYLRSVRFSGHVFNLETATSTYISNGIVVHNCRCSATYHARTADGTMVDISQTPRLTPLSPRNLGGGRGRPLTPTTSVTLNEGTRGTIVLADLSTATLTYRDGVLTVTRNGAQLGWGTITVDASGRLTAEAIGVGLGADNLGIAELIARSIATTNDWRAGSE